MASTAGSRFLRVSRSGKGRDKSPPAKIPRNPLKSSVAQDTQVAHAASVAIENTDLILDLLPQIDS
jgi:hypothetical protein